MQREKGSGPRRDRFIETPRLWLTSMLVRPSLWRALSSRAKHFGPEERTRVPATSVQDFAVQYRLYWKQKG